ncbi:hypothetical protein [Zongyangia hominis]|uniref:Uncharacterized protein n=1 Tax=Zongyangia hominis TaxID=2763677 RepID=A0A926EDT4_9FIRM|nr:hypothetical protein [Zongyangia hominis]MBC8569907.1 hypothetical protein [Zongyangia hominis]
MLYLVCVLLTDEEHPGFFAALEELGETIEIFCGCHLLHSRYTALGIRRRLAGHLSHEERLVVTRLRRGECAGQLSDFARQFLGRYIDGLVE